MSGPTSSAYATTASQAREISSRIERFDRLLRDLTGAGDAPAKSVLGIYAVDRQKKFEGLFPLRPGATGLYSVSARGAVALIFTEGGAEESWRTLYHEYAHHFVQAHFPAYYPDWYNEGFAEFVETAVISSELAVVGRPGLSRARALLQGRWMPMSEVIAGMPKRATVASLDQFYAESWLLTHYVFADPGRRARLPLYLAAVQRGRPSSSAFEEAFAIAPDVLDAELKRYMATRLSVFTVQVSASAHSASAPRLIANQSDDPPLLMASLIVGNSTVEARERLLRRARAAAEAASTGLQAEWANRVAAAVELEYGDSARAGRILDGLLGDAPADSQLLGLRGVAFRREAERDKAAQRQPLLNAKRSLEQSVQTDPRNYPATYQLGRTLLALDPSDEEAERHLLTASQAAPLVREIADAAAQAAARSGRCDLARKILAPLASFPHRGARLGNSLLDRAAECPTPVWPSITEPE